jgi:RNA polymerase sigma factor (sigma-70 family)
VKGGKEVELKSNYQNEELDVNSLDKEELIEQLMNLYVEKVYLLAYSFVKDRGMAEDISQEVFFRCYKYLDQFRGDSSLKSWIYRITVNTSMDFLRKKGSRHVFVEDGFLETFSQTETPETAFLRADENERVLQAVLILPIKYREVILMHYFLDVPVIDIADAVNINLNTVKTRLKRGREILKKKLERG